MPLAIPFSGCTSPRTRILVPNQIADVQEWKEGRVDWVDTKDGRHVEFGEEKGTIVLTDVATEQFQIRGISVDSVDVVISDDQLSLVQLTVTRGDVAETIVLTGTIVAAGIVTLLYIALSSFSTI